MQTRLSVLRCSEKRRPGRTRVAYPNQPNNHHNNPESKYNYSGNMQTVGSGNGPEVKPKLPHLLSLFLDHFELVCARKDDLRTVAVFSDFTSYFDRFAFEIAHFGKQIGFFRKNDGRKRLLGEGLVQVQIHGPSTFVHLDDCASDNGIGPDMVFGLGGADREGSSVGGRLLSPAHAEAGERQKHA